VFICNRPLSAVLAALAAAAAFVVTDELYRQDSKSMTETAETAAAPTAGCKGSPLLAPRERLLACPATPRG
jgi:hypothetical protein